MLGHLQVKDFALIEEIEVEPGPGLNVITGETGAGKSLFVDAIQVALGARASTDLIRTGSESAAVWALFELPKDSSIEVLLEELGIEAPDGTILVEREIRRERANRARINGRLASVSAISDFSAAMVELHGQHEQRGLLDPSRQREILDATGGEELLAARSELRDLVRNLRDIERQQSEILGDERERARRLDLLRYQLAEIEAAELSVGEEEELLERRNRMANLETLRSSGANALGRLSEGSPERLPILEELGEIDDELGRAVALDSSVESIHRGVQSGLLELEEAARSLRRYLEDLAFDEEDQRRVEQRLQFMADLKRKYGASVAEVLEYAEKVRREIDEIESSEAEAERLRELRLEVEESLGAVAEDLGRLRSEAALCLEEMVEGELADLHMGGTRFEVRLTRREDPEGIAVEGKPTRVGFDGAEEVEFLIAPNPGEPPRPLRRIASGGELARISLALESAAAGVEAPPTLIFDEIDAGVGGRAGTAVAKKLAGLAAKHQVLCVTHLPQIAALADAHFYLTKEVRGNRTVSSLKRLESDERIEEIARMLAGDIDREAALEHARSMVATNHR